MKLLLALTAMFAFLAFCFWFSTPGGFLGACDYANQPVLPQAQDGEQQQWDLVNPDMLNLFPNERIYTSYDGQSVGISEAWYNHAFLKRYEGETRHSAAYGYRPGIASYLKQRHSSVNHLII